jgi:hypothetical protein
MFNTNQAFLLVQKLKSALRALFTLGVKPELEKIFSICPKLLINAELDGLVLAPRLKKKDTIQFGRPKKKPKMLKVGPKFFGP